MELKVVTTRKGLFDLKPSWDELFKDSGIAHPFLCFAWVLSWWDHMPTDNTFQRHELHIISIYSGDSLLAIVPMFKTSYLSWLLGGIRYLRPIGSDKNLTEIKGVLCRPENERKSIHCLMRHFQGQGSQWDILRWPDITAENATRELRWHRACLIENFVVPLAPTWEEFLSGRKRNLKESIRKCYNATARQDVALTFDTVKDRQEIISLMPAFYRLHGARATCTKSAIAHPDYYLDAAHRQFLEGFMTTCDSAEPRLFLLKHGEKIVAARLAFVANQALYLYYSGYDLGYASFSVMTRLVVESIKSAIASGITCLNLSTGKDVSKTRWSPDVISYLSSQVFSKNYRARVMKLLAPYAQIERYFGECIPCAEEEISHGPNETDTVVGWQAGNSPANPLVGAHSNILIKTGGMRSELEYY